MIECDLCQEEFDGAPFTIVNPMYRIENVCGTCMNLYANEEFDELCERMFTEEEIEKIGKEFLTKVSELAEIDE